MLAHITFGWTAVILGIGFALGVIASATVAWWSDRNIARDIREAGEVYEVEDRGGFQ